MDTGLGLWAVALPLLVIAYVADLIVPPDGPVTPGFARAFGGVFAGVLAAVVLTFLALARHGYRWARTVLTGGGAASVVYAVSGLFGVHRPDASALIHAATTIVGSVCILGGAYLLHRPDANGYFTR